MVKVLIPTKPDDAHALYVKLALEKKGHQCVLWYTADFPEKQLHAFELHGSKILWNGSGVDFNVDDNNFDVVWLRRPCKPMLPDTIHKKDIKNATSENLAFFRTFWQVIAPNAFWINSIDTANAANCKLLQLKIAVQVGLNVPATLVSNNPEKIKNFIKKHSHTAVIYKPLYPVMWVDKNEMRLTYTDEIKIDNLPSDSMLQNTAGIFQNKIKARSKGIRLRSSARLKSFPLSPGRWSHLRNPTVPTQTLSRRNN